MNSIAKNQGKIKIDITSLLEFSKVVNQDVSIDFVINFFLLTIMGKLICNKAIVFLKDENNIYFIKNSKGVLLKDKSKVVRLANKYTKLIYLNDFKKKGDEFTEFLRKNKLQFFLPLIYRKAILGYVALSKFNNKKLSYEEANYLKSIVNIFASALQQKLDRDELKRLNKELDHKIHQMYTLFDLSKELASTLNREKLIKLLTLSLMGQLGVSKFAIYIKDKGELKKIAARSLDITNSKIVDKICCIKKPIVVDEFKNTSDGKFLKKNKIKAIVPMVSQNEIKGFLLLGERLNGKVYSQTDLEFLYSLSNITIISLENIRLFNEAIEKQKMEDELLIAKEIQQGLFPKELPKHKNLDLSAVNLPSKIVGGDYYDVLDLGDEKFAVAIADVSGKGIPAALLMASIQAMFHTLIKLNIPLNELVKTINGLIYDYTSTDRFITFFIGIINMKDRKVSYVNAGHNFPIFLKNNGDIYRLDKGGMLLGIAKENVDYIEDTLFFESGDLLCIFTDGITETLNSDSIDFNEERLIKILSESRNLTAERIKNRIIDEVRSFSNGHQNDDITLIIVKIK